MINLSNDDFIINSGDSIAQLVVSKHEQPNLEQTDSLDSTSRGEKGFGSTGVN